MRAAAVALAALVLLGVPATAAAKSFHTPSGNIACLYSAKGGPGAFLRCDVHSLNDTAFRLDRRHRGKRVHVTDAVPAGHTLAYGRTLRLGPFKCRSRRTGLTCRSRTRHGFFLSRARQRVF
jgi:hypothetical protein